MVPGSHLDTAPDEAPSAALFAPGNVRPFALVTSLFFLWGIPNNLNDVLIRQFMTSFAITRFEAGLVQSAFYLGYFLLAAPAAMLMRRTSYKAGMIVGLLLFGSGACLFYPAAQAESYSYFLLALFVIASGLSFLETASNPFVTLLGPPATAEQRINLAQAFNPIGSIAGVLLGTVFIFSGVELSPAQIAAKQAAHTYLAYRHAETLRVVTPYLVLGAIAFVLAIVLLRTQFPVLASETEDTVEHKGSLRALLGYRHFVLAVLAQFMYVGAQVGTWSYFITYAQEYGHQSERFAGLLLTGTLGAFCLGRFASARLMRVIAPEILMGWFSVINVVLVAVAILFPGWLGLWAVFLTSFFMSTMFPTIFALGLKGLGPMTKTAGSMLVMAIIGGAVLTPLMGLISEGGRGVAPAYVVPLVGYLCVGAFAFFGSAYRGPAVENARP
jgi:FHS family L-fucose permease-like MFS transporter